MHYASHNVIQIVQASIMDRTSNRRNILCDHLGRNGLVHPVQDAVTYVGDLAGLETFDRSTGSDDGIEQLVYEPGAYRRTDLG